MNPELPCPGDCAFSRGAPCAPFLDAPVGYVRRVAAVEGEVDETKRNLLKLAAVAGVLGVGVGGVAGGALQYVQPPVIGIGSYPRTQLFDAGGAPLTLDRVQGTKAKNYTDAEYSDATSDLFLFNYPLRNEPNFLLNLYPTVTKASNVPYGIGDNGSIVAYSAICQHLGCPAPAISYYPPGTCPRTFSTKAFPTLSLYIHCSCHGSTYDVTNGASNLTGPAVLPLPQVILESDSDGNIFATGMTPNSPPVNGHLNTLQGDYGVGSSSQLAKESPVILCTNFPP
jgi:Rieske Fe-S protein